MRQLLPTLVDPVDPMAVYGDLPAPPGRPAVRLNMIASVDGATTVGGVSGGLGGRADRALFLRLRSLADGILVAAGTVRAEGYRPSVTPIAVVSRSLRLDWETPFFTAPIARPILLTVARAPADQRGRAAELADVVVAGDRDVDLAVALAALAERGWRNVLAEGGPTLNGQLARAGLLDELCLTLSPRLAGGAAKRLLDGPAVPDLALRLCSACEEDEFLFLRYRPSPARPA
ncbi:MAG TPA: dihydrofolate reductase family protein [Actinomycetes bacterium]|jgi:riboflavin biosynthesis pyrimidine reductase|nr:dihydrofolate reductase family protein [Actinomycetes bacterium]